MSGDEQERRPRRGAEVDDGRHARPAQSLLGSWLHGRYEVLRELGWGSLGHVYEALDHLRPDERGAPGRVALKVIRRDRLTPRSVAFLKQEFRALSSLDHPHVARVHDLGVVPGRGELFFSLELLLGPTLVARARAPGGGPALAVELAVQALRALGYVHARGLIHMDVKPQNLLVTERAGAPHLKLLDFHLVQEQDAPQEREMRGTIAYMPPEVIKGEPVDPRADLYSLGAVLYEALGGRPPFAHAGSAMDMLRAHASDPPPPLRELGVEVDPALEAVLRRLLQKDPAERFAGADEAIRALAAASGREFPRETEETRRCLTRTGRFVGRDQELEQALRPARQLASRREGAWEPWVWLVRGPSGAGKSRFLQELKVACQLEGLPCLLLRPGGVDAAAFGPFREALAELLRRAGRQALLAELVDEAGAVDPGRLSAQRGDPSLPPRVRQGSALRELLEELAREAPCALLLDDLDQADDGTLAVVQALASGPAPGLLLVASVAAEASGPGGRLAELFPLPGVQPLELGQLGRAATRELLLSMSPGEPPAEELVSRVWALGGGNPRFVGDVLRGLLEGEEHRTPEGAPRLDAEAAERLLPAASLAELSQRRVALLDPEARLLLAALAVSPRPRPLAFAAAVARLPLPRARAVLRELERRGFAERLPGGGWEREQWPVAVEHAPLREAALAATDAVELHVRAARLIESRHPVAQEPVLPGARGAPAADRAEELLWHLERAGDRAGALRYAWQAGQAALRRGEPLRALGLLRRAEAAASQAAPGQAAPGQAAAGLPEAGELSLALAEALAATGDPAGAGARLEALAAASPTARALRALGAFLRETGHLERALTTLDRARALAGEGDPEGPRVEADRARTLLWMGEYRAALAAGEAALRGFAAGGEPPPGELLVALAHAAQFLGRPAEAQEWLRRGLQAAPAALADAAASDAVRSPRPPLLGDAAGVQVARAPLEAALLRSERAGDAARHWARRVQLLEAAGDADGAAWAELNLAHLRRAAGEHLGARVAYERARRSFEAVGNRLGLALVRLGLARALAEGGAAAAAAREAAAALALGETLGARWVPAQAEVARAEAALAQGRLDEAGAALAVAGERARALEHAPLLAELDLLQAELALLRRDAAGARTALAAWDEAPGGAPSALLSARADLAQAELAALGPATDELLGPAEARASAAVSLAERAGLPELAWRAAATRARVRAARGDAEGELADLVRGLEVLRGLCERVPAEVRAEYLADPRRAALRERFRALQQAGS